MVSFAIASWQDKTELPTLVQIRGCSHCLIAIAQTGSWLTSRGYFLKAGSNRLLQYLWNQIVSSGRKMSRGVEYAAFFVLINPNRVT